MAPRRRIPAGGCRIKNHLVPKYEVARVQGGRARIVSEEGTHRDGKGENHGGVG